MVQRKSHGILKAQICFFVGYYGKTTKKNEVLSFGIYFSLETENSFNRPFTRVP